DPRRAGDPADEDADSDTAEKGSKKNAAGPCRVERGRRGGLHARGEISKPDDSACNTQIASVAAFSRKFVTLAHVALPRLLLVHGGVVNGDAPGPAQQALPARFELGVPTRRGFPPGPDVDHVDFEDEAGRLDEFLEPGTHLVGHSYGGVIALLTAARRPD